MSKPSSQQPKPRHKRTTYKENMTRISLSISPGILDLVDSAAKQDFTTRSDIIRMAILWYLRPQGRELDQTDPKIILKTLQHRQSRLALRKMLKDLGMV